MRIAAIDPGVKGGIAWMNLMVYHAEPMPATFGDMLALLRRIRVDADTAYIEHVVGFIPGGGAGAMFSFGENFGYLQGCLDALGFRVIRVRPQTWQKALQLGDKGPKVKADKDASTESKKAALSANAKRERDWKNKLKSEAQRRFPDLTVTLQTADALLLLDYAATLTSTK